MEYVNEMREERMKKIGDKASITSSNDGSKKEVPNFVPADSFLKSGECDGEMQNIGTESSIAKGDKSPAIPKLEKGKPGPQGPGVV